MSLFRKRVIMYLNHLFKKLILTTVCACAFSTTACARDLPLVMKAYHAYMAKKSLPLYYWQEKFINFGDYLSLKLVERILEISVRVYDKNSGIKE